MKGTCLEKSQKEAIAIDRQKKLTFRLSVEF